MSRNCTASEMEISMLRERVSTLETLVTKLISVTEKHNTAMADMLKQMEAQSHELHLIRKCGEGTTMGCKTIADRVTKLEGKR